VKRLLTGELRPGALAGLMVDAVAKAAGVPGSLVRRALMLSGDLTRTAEVALAEGERRPTREGCLSGAVRLARSPPERGSRRAQYRDLAARRARPRSFLPAAVARLGPAQHPRSAGGWIADVWRS
jgi:ATP-dependent DNA ligase